MRVEQYIELLQKPYDWDLQEEEKEIAVRMAREFGGRRILHAWHEFQEEAPLDGFDRFEKWFRERKDGVEVGTAEGRGPGEIETGGVSDRQLELEASPFAGVYRRIGRLPKEAKEA